MSSLPAFKSIQLQWLGNLCIDTNISDNAMRVAAFIALKYVNGETGTAWPSFQTLAKALGKSVKTIQRAIRELESASWFTIKRGNGLSHNTEYKPSYSSILTASKHKEKPVKIVTLSDNKTNESVTNLSTEGGQICPPNLRNKNNNIPPPLSPSVPHKAEREEGDQQFSKLWKKWPEKMHPKSRALTEQLFAALTLANQSKAIRFASDYCLNMELRNELCLLIPYLKDKLFLVFEDGPPVDKSGYFKVTPECKEWPEWEKHIQQTYGIKALNSMINLGFLIAKTRSPIPPLQTNIYR